MNDLINEKQTSKIYYLQQNAYFQAILKRIIEEYNGNLNLNLNKCNNTNLTKLSCVKPICEIPCRLLIVNVTNSNLLYDNTNNNGYLILTNNNKMMTFSKSLQIRFENLVNII